MNRKAFVVLVGSMFISMMGMGLVTPFLPIYADTMGASGLEVGLIQAAFNITGIGTLLFVGRLSDRFGRKSFLSGGLTVLAIASVGFIFAKNPGQLILWRFVQGLGASAHLPIAQAYLGDITPEGNEGKWMGYFNAVLFAGMGAGPLLGGVIADAFSMKACFLTMAVLNILGLIATLLFLMEMPRKIGTREHASYTAPLKSRIMRGILIYRMTAGLGTASLMAFVPLFAEQKLGMSTILIGIVLASRTPASIIQSYTGRLADRWNRRRMVFWSGMATVLTTLFLPSTVGFWTLLIVLIFTVLGQSFGMPAANAFIVDEGRTYGMGASMTMFMLAMQIGNGIGPVALGGISDRLGLNSVFYSAAVVMASGILLCDRILRRSSITKTEQGNS